MTATIERPPCASCGGSNLTPGNFGFQFRFVPAGFAGVIWNAYQPAGAACLDCGFIGPYLTPAQIAKLRGKLERRAGAAKGG